MLQLRRWRRRRRAGETAACQIGDRTRYFAAIFARGPDVRLAAADCPDLTRNSAGTFDSWPSGKRVTHHAPKARRGRLASQTVADLRRELDAIDREILAAINRRARGRPADRPS